MTRSLAFFRKPPPPPSRGSEAQTEVLEKEQLDAEIGGDYIAASADFRDGDDAENGSENERLTAKSEATKTPPPPTSGSGRPQELLLKEVLDTDFRGDYIAASADHRR